MEFPFVGEKGLHLHSPSQEALSIIALLHMDAPTLVLFATLIDGV